MRAWWQGLLAAALSGAGLALGAMAVDPAHFNSAHPRHLAIVAIGGACVGVANYLQRSPLQS